MSVCRMCQVNPFEPWGLKPWPLPQGQVCSFLLLRCVRLPRVRTGKCVALLTHLTRASNLEVPEYSICSWAWSKTGPWACSNRSLPRPILPSPSPAPAALATASGFPLLSLDCWTLPREIWPRAVLRWQCPTPRPGDFSPGQQAVLTPGKAFQLTPLRLHDPAHSPCQRENHLCPLPGCGSTLRVTLPGPDL